LVWLAGILDRREKKKEVLELSRELKELDAAEPTTLGAALDAGERSGPLSRELGELDAAEPTTLGAALDAGERSGPLWTGDAWLARRRRYSTARRDRAHNLKEAKGRAGTVRSNQRSSNTL